MNLKHLSLGILGFIFINGVSMAASPMERYLSKIAIFEEGDGRKINTYEDVYVNLNPFQERNKKYPIVNTNQIPEGYVSKDTAKQYFKKFSSNAVVTEEDISFKDFMNEHFSIETITGFPQSYYGSKPGSFTYVLKMDDDYSYVESFKEYAPDAISCKSDRSLCDSSCEYRHKNKKNIYADFKNNLLSKAKVIDAEEVNNSNNVIKMSFVSRTPPEITFDGSVAEESNDFPVLGGDMSYAPCTTGDWYLTPNGIIIGKSDKPLYNAKFSFGRFGECPDNGEDWKDKENWTNLENIVRIEYGNSDSRSKKTNELLKSAPVIPNGIPYFRDVVRFEPFDGFIRYSIFAKEGEADGILPTNPSIIVKEDRPEIGYGYPTAGDLGNTIDTAKDWPDKRKLGEISGKGYSTGLLRVYDNDRPNIIIRITNVETDEQMFFPPCVASSECRISFSSKYKPMADKGKTNHDDYAWFVENLGPDYNYKVLEKVAKLRPYYTIYSIDDTSIKTKTEGSFIDRLLFNKDLDFINENVRVEDYYFSDTEEKGGPTYNSGGARRGKFKGSFGRRHGTFSNMVAMFENTGTFRFKTGVEYKLDVWTDDNVKWTNVEYEDSINNGPEMHYEYVKNTGLKPAGNSSSNSSSKSESESNDDHIQLMVGKAKLMDEAKVYETGIKAGIIKLDIPNGSENLNEEQEIDITKHINGGIYFTLKDGTPNLYDLKTVKELESNGFPSISVAVEDYSGLKRQLRLFFRVNDRNLDVKVLENAIK